MEIPEAIKLIQGMKSWMPSDNKNFDKEREAIDRVLSHITTPNKTGLDDRLRDKLIEQPDNQEYLSNKKDRLYTAKDMENFSVWAYNNGWYYGELTEAWYNSEQLDDTRHTIKEVIKLWEATE